MTTPLTWSARLDARLTLQSYPHKFLKIAYKKYAGYPLTVSERTLPLPAKKQGLQVLTKKFGFSVTFWQIFSDIISERVENLLQRIEQCQRVAGWARLWTIEYQDFRQSKS